MTDKAEILTDDEIYPLYNEPTSDKEALEFARAVEAAVLRKLAEQEKIGRIAATLEGVLRQEVMLYTDKLLPIGTPLYAAPVPKE